MELGLLKTFLAAAGESDVTNNGYHPSRAFPVWALCQALCGPHTSAFNLPNNPWGGWFPVILPLYSDSARPRTLPKANGVSSGTVQF